MSSAISSHPVTLSNLHPLGSQHDIVTNLLPEAPEERRRAQKGPDGAMEPFAEMC